MKMEIPVKIKAEKLNSKTGIARRTMRKRMGR